MMEKKDLWDLLIKCIHSKDLRTFLEKNIKLGFLCCSRKKLTCFCFERTLFAFDCEILETALFAFDCEILSLECGSPGGFFFLETIYPIIVPRYVRVIDYTELAFWAQNILSWNPCSLSVNHVDLSSRALLHPLSSLL